MKIFASTEENEALVRERVDWDQLMFACRMTLDAREEFPRDGGDLFAFAGDVLSMLVGPVAMGAIADPVSRSLPRGNALALWGKRLKLLAWLIRSLGSPEQIGLVQLGDELIAIANGGVPMLFDRLPGSSSYRLASHKLEALAWEKYMRAHDEKPGDVQSKIGAAFGENWSTISRWEPSVRKALGDHVVDRKFQQADAGTWGVDCADFEDNWREIERLGDAYKQARRDHKDAAGRSG